VEVAKVYFGDGVRRWYNIPYKNKTELDKIKRNCKKKMRKRKNI